MQTFLKRLQQVSPLKSHKIPLHPPFPKGDEVESSIEFPKSSPPFEKGRTEGISGPPEADQRAKVLQAFDIREGEDERGNLVLTPG